MTNDLRNTLTAWTIAALIVLLIALSAAAVVTTPQPAQPAPPVVEVPPGDPFGNGIALKRRSVSWIGNVEVRSYELPPWASVPSIPPQPMLPPQVDLTVPMPLPAPQHVPPSPYPWPPINVLP